MVATALRKDDAFENPAPAPSRDAVLARYRHLRAITIRHHSKILELLSKDAIIHYARRLGLTFGKTLLVGDMDEMTLAFDLAIHTAPAGRSRAIDRYARSAGFAAGCDDARVLEAMCGARFAIVSVERRHDVAGLVVTDLIRHVELWLVDEGLEISLPEGTVFATRYFTPDRFSMTAGAGMPIDIALLRSALDSARHLVGKSHSELVEDRRFAEAIYRAAIADGVMDGVAYLDLDDPSGVRP